MKKDKSTKVRKENKYFEILFDDNKFRELDSNRLLAARDCRSKVPAKVKRG